MAAYLGYTLRMKTLFRGLMTSYRSRHAYEKKTCNIADISNRVLCILKCFWKYPSLQTACRISHCHGVIRTSSSAVAERPRDALCLSAFSLNSTIPALASDLPVRTVKFFSVVFGLRVINTSLSVSRDQQMPQLLPAMRVTNLPRSDGTVFITCDGRTI